MKQNKKIGTNYEELNQAICCQMSMTEPHEKYLNNLNLCSDRLKIQFNYDIMNPLRKEKYKL